MTIVNNINDLRPGDIMIGPIGGLVGAGVALGQLIVDGGFRVGQLDVRHAAIVTPMGKIVQAMPSGAEEVPLTDKHWTSKYAYVRLPEDYPGQARDAAAIAQAMIGIPYSFLSYAALAAWHWGISTPKLEAWIGRRGKSVELDSWSSGVWNHPRGGRLPVEAICSVLVDQAWSLAGKKIFQDGRPHQCVTPSQLAQRLLTYPGCRWSFPGTPGITYIS